MKGNGNGEFYVYALIDPRTGEAFYVGKGKGSRHLCHETETRRGGGSAKSCRIRDIWAVGLQVEHRKLAEGLDETSAYRIERETIAAKRDTLTNLSPGGGPASVHPERARKKAAFQEECRRLVDDIAVPTILFSLACRDVLDMNNSAVRRSLRYLSRAGIREIHWHRELIEATP